MILSAEQRFSDAQVVTGDAESTNIIDLGLTGTVLGAPAALVRDIGKGKPIQILVQLRVDATGTTPTLDVTLEVDDNAGFASTKIVATSEQVVGGVAGERVRIFWVPEGTDEQFLRLFYNTGGTSPQYDVDAGIVLADQTND